MATTKKTTTNDNWLNKKVQYGVASAGAAVGSVAYGAGNGVASVGRGIGNSIANTTRYWGQGIAGYGNEIKDSVRAGGPRVPTAGNPLGLSGAGQGNRALRLPGVGAGSGSGSGSSQQKRIGGGSANPLGLK